MTDDKRGRPPIEQGKRMRQKMITVDDETVQILREIGHGNLSQGIRFAAKTLSQNFTMPMGKNDS